MTATVRQGTRQVPARWPLSADWTGSPTLHLGPRPAEAHRHHVASFDPSTGRLTALRRGAFTLTVRVNGTATEVAVTVAPTPGADRATAGPAPLVTAGPTGPVPYATTGPTAPAPLVTAGPTAPVPYATTGPPARPRPRALATGSAD